MQIETHARARSILYIYTFYAYVRVYFFLSLVHPRPSGPFGVWRRRVLFVGRPAWYTRKRLRRRDISLFYFSRERSPGLRISNGRNKSRSDFDRVTTILLQITRSPLATPSNNTPADFVGVRPLHIFIFSRFSGGRWVGGGGKRVDLFFLACPFVQAPLLLLLLLLL